MLLIGKKKGKVIREEENGSKSWGDCASQNFLYKVDFFLHYLSKTDLSYYRVGPKLLLYIDRVSKTKQKKSYFYT